MNATTPGTELRRPAGRVQREGEDGLYTQSWFPLCYSRDVPFGQVVGRAFLGGRVVVFRQANGEPVVASAYCRHLGTDLSLGSLMDGRLRCPFHHWEYEASGRCVLTGTGDPPPPSARLFRFPACEKYGVIFAFNGTEPAWQIPDLGRKEADVDLQPQATATVAIDPWMFTAQTPDISHFKLVHGFEFDIDAVMDSVEWLPTGLRYKMQVRTPIGGDTLFTFVPEIHGTSIFFVNAEVNGKWLGFWLPFGLPRAGQTEIFSVVAIDRNAPPDSATMELVGRQLQSMVAEDAPILNSMKYSSLLLTRADRVLARYLQMVRDYPRADPAGEFIR